VSSEALPAGFLPDVGAGFKPAPTEFYLPA